MIKKINNKGISLIILVITIIITIIIAGAIIISTFSQNNIFTKSREASFKSDVTTFKQELEIYKANHYSEIVKEPLNKSGYLDIKEIIPSFTNKYENKFKIINNELIWISSEDSQENEWALEAGITPRAGNMKVKIEIQGEGNISGKDVSYNLLDTANFTATAKSKNINGTSVQYVFDGWYESGKLLTKNATLQIQVTGDKIYTAVFVPSEYSLIYYLDENQEEKVILDSSTTLVGYKGRTDITKIETGNNCNQIGVEGFYNCSNLVTVNLSDSVSSLLLNSFRGCTALNSINIPSHCSLKNSVFIGNIKITSIKIPSLSIKGSSWAFEKCTGLTDVTIGDKNDPVIYELDKGFFYDCIQNGLTIKIYLPSGQTSLVGEPWGATNSTVEYYDATTGELVNVIWGCKYKGNTEIVWTELPNADKITKIRATAFQGCTNLALTSLPKNLTELEYGVFYSCPNITIKEIPSHCSLKNSVFSGNIKITSIKIPSLSIKGSSWTFQKCRGLTDVTIGDKNDPVIYELDKGFFYDCIQNGLTIKIYLPSGQTSLAGEPWGATNSTVEYYDATTGELVNVIWGCKYKGNTEIAWTELPNADKITKIRATAFYGCTNLALTCLPKNLTELEYGVFYSCPNITIKEIPSHCSLKNSVFSGNIKITSIKIPSLSIKGSSWTFQKCRGLTDVTIGDKNDPVIYELDKGFFYDCIQNGLTIKIYLPSGQTSLAGEPWGATNATIEYYDATTGNLITN